MKRIFFTGLLLLAGLVIITAGKTFTRNSGTMLMDRREIISCMPPPADIAANENGKFITMLTGWGHHQYSISTKTDSAQLYFNQGINFYYSYHFREALASFKEAARFDENSAMTYWGQALAMGPYYNNYNYKMKSDVPRIVSLMKTKMTTASEKEQALVNAMQLRYSNDTTNSDRNRLDSSYSTAMLALTKRYPGDNDIKALYIDAVMLRHKWDFWNNDGDPKPWTTELVNLCQEILQKDPQHPAALHYYIHLTEASKHPELALHSADVLKDAMPGVGHMVHMATHMYQRNGLFAKGVYVNEDANTANNHVDSLVPSLGIGRNTILHIYAVQSYCAMNAGMSGNGRPIYFRARNRLLDLRTAIDKDLYSQYIFMMPVIAWVRLGNWQEILQSASPDPSWKYASILDNFAKGLAYVHNKDLAAAKACLNKMEANFADSLMNVRQMPFNKPVQCGYIAAGILKGELYFEAGNTNEAIAALRKAVEEEDRLIYSEPQDWLIPRKTIPWCISVENEQTKGSRKSIQEDLVANPGNGWSLLGMYNSLQAQKKIKEAIKFKDVYLKAFSQGDIDPVASVF